MDTRIIIFILVFLYYLFLGEKRNNPKAKNKLVWFSCALLILQSGLRHVEVGADTIGYYSGFMNTMKMGWSELLLVTSESRDPGYRIVAKAFSSIIPEWQVYLIALATLFYYAMGRLWQRYINSAEGVLLATVLVLSLFNVIALSGIRQMITMSISMLLIPYIEQKKWKVVVPVLLLGSFIHLSILFVFAFIPLQYIKKGKYKMLIGLAIIMIPIVIVYARTIVGFMAMQTENEYYMGYAETVNEAKPYAYIALCSIISLFLFINYKSLKNAPTFFSSALVLMTLSFPLIIQDGTMIRIGQYFTIYIMLSIPLVLDGKQSKNLFYFGMISVLLLFMLNSKFDYHFFWENVVK